MTRTSPDTARAGSGATSMLPMAAALVTVVLWASAFVAIRHVGREFTAGPLAQGRLLVGSVLLGGFVLARPRHGAAGPRRWPTGHDWLPLLVCGVLWFGLYNVALNEAERRIDAGTAAMVIAIGPLVLALLAGLFLGEGFPRQLVLGSAVAFSGVVVIGVASSSRNAQTVGVLLCVLAAVAYAVAVVAQKPLLGRLRALEVTWLACTIGTICCLPFLPALIRQAADAHLSTVAWLVYLGAFPTALAFTTWAYALSHTTAGKMGATTYLVPPIAVALGWMLLGETPAGPAFAGGALCLAGVYLSRRAPSRGKAPAPAELGAPQ